MCPKFKSQAKFTHLLYLLLFNHFFQIRFFQAILTNTKLQVKQKSHLNPYLHIYCNYEVTKIPFLGAPQRALSISIPMIC